jgi:hypothetical protein
MSVKTVPFFLGLMCNTNFLNACYRYFSGSPLDKGGWGGQSVASEKEIGIISKKSVKSVTILVACKIKKAQLTTDQLGI